MAARPKAVAPAATSNLEAQLKAVILPTLQKLGDWAHARDLTLSQLALAWLLHQPAMSAPIIGATKPEQIQENVKASDVKLSVDDLAQLEDILKPTKEEK